MGKHICKLVKRIKFIIEFQDQYLSKITVKTSLSSKFIGNLADYLNKDKEVYTKVDLLAVCSKLGYTRASTWKKKKKVLK